MLMHVECLAQGKHLITVFYDPYDDGGAADLGLGPVNRGKLLSVSDLSGACGRLIRCRAQEPRLGGRKPLPAPLNFSYVYVFFELVIQLFLLEREQSE